MWTKNSDQRLMISADFNLVSMDVQEEFVTAPLYRQGFPLKRTENICFLVELVYG